MTRAALAVLVLGVVAMALAQDRGRDDAVALAKQALRGKLGVTSDTLQVEKAEAVDWPDASLGCPEKGMMYAQMITPGYRVVLRAGGQTHEVHVGAGWAVPCGGSGKTGSTAKPRAPARTRKPSGG